MPRKAVPKGWSNYTCFKDSITNTRIIPFKTPLKESAFYSRPDLTRWTPRDVLDNIPNLGLIINLTFADQPYYIVEEFEKMGVMYVKIPCVGQQVPSSSVVNKFTDTVEKFVTDDSMKTKLIGVHCTHGVNRTGYVVCRYLIDKLKLDPVSAINEFQTARGHEIDRAEYVHALIDLPF